jgi:hypothetical protein
MEVVVGSLAGAPILIVEADPAMSRLLEAAVIAADGAVAASTSDFASALDFIERRPAAAVLLALFTNGVRCDEIAAELARRSIPFVVTAGMHCQRQAKTPADIKHFQIQYVIERLGDLLRAQDCDTLSGSSDEVLHLTHSANDDERTAA